MVAISIFVKIEMEHQFIFRNLEFKIGFKKFFIPG